MALYLVSGASELQLNGGSDVKRKSIWNKNQTVTKLQLTSCCAMLTWLVNCFVAILLYVL